MAVSGRSSGFFANFPALRRWAYNLSGFNKYGLHHDDCLDETEDVKEALRRLPLKVLDERNFRIQRALQLSLTKDILPKEEWTKFEQDNRYLQPYLEEVKKEREEREQWNKN
ncbi:cytochrome b-c1 complex subunit 7-like [Hetaerina americana]|uniref:cytochrome b-c1 complex subunit 7-like n=1 Tax=Hetaerina americana TaxID=62018 RepID=UPI003A7F3F8F